MTIFLKQYEHLIVINIIKRNRAKDGVKEIVVVGLQTLTLLRFSLIEGHKTNKTERYQK